MAHRSKKKHLKHIHEHEPATPKARSPVEKARAAAAGIAKKGGNGRRAKPANGRRRQAQPGNGAPKGTPPKATPTTAPAKKKGIVRRLAARARRRITARPRRVVARVKARVKSLLGDHA